MGGHIYLHEHGEWLTNTASGTHDDHLPGWQGGCGARGGETAGGLGHETGDIFVHDASLHGEVAGNRYSSTRRRFARARYMSKLGSRSVKYLPSGSRAFSAAGPHRTRPISPPEMIHDVSTWIPPLHCYPIYPIIVSLRAQSSLKTQSDAPSAKESPLFLPSFFPSSPTTCPL